MRCRIRLRLILALGDAEPELRRATAASLHEVVNGMNLLQINASWQPLATGVIVLLAVWIDIATRRDTD